MHLSHVYQPLLIEALLDAGGIATLRQLASVFALFDESQIIYYEKKLKTMPIPVLSRHGVISWDDDLVRLNIKPLSIIQRAELKRLCQTRLQEYIERRGLSIWDYRLMDETPVSDSLRFRVLKEAKGRCALCGITLKELPLDIDHIIPISKGGKTEYSNLQVLCSKCNRSKGNKDTTDFRNIISDEKVLECPFCQAIVSDRIIQSGDLVYAMYDKYPVTPGHTLIIPKRHFTDLFEMGHAEWSGLWSLAQVIRRRLIESDRSISGFNMGINSGQDAGQTIDHCHVHLIPRRRGDVREPKGGVRGVIPGKNVY